jgi:GNAT superfamily N-acetyltransferase
MPITFLPLPAEQFSSWMKRSTAEYIADLLASGVPDGKAREDAHTTMTRAFPYGLPSATNAVFTLESPALGNVGYLWIGCDSSGDPTSWWVWDIVIEAGHRGHGLGRQAMVLAEKYARSHGAQTLGLNVFGFNRAARGLYESLGYETTSVKMRKTL